jgi:hypothetical protein
MQSTSATSCNELVLAPHGRAQRCAKSYHQNEIAKQVIAVKDFEAALSTREPSELVNSRLIKRTGTAALCADWGVIVRRSMDLRSLLARHSSQHICGKLGQ